MSWGNPIVYSLTPHPDLRITFSGFFCCESFLSTDNHFQDVDWQGGNAQSVFVILNNPLNAIKTREQSEEYREGRWWRKPCLCTVVWRFHYEMRTSRHCKNIYACISHKTQKSICMENNVLHTNVTQKYVFGPRAGQLDKTRCSSLWSKLEV